MFIIIDGIDGSGKSTVLKTWISELETQGKKIFDLTEYHKKHGIYPNIEEMEAADIIITGEPTHALIGKAIRLEMIKKGNKYSASAIADAYSLDRLILYKKVILPMRKLGKIILQDRSVTTSLCYQSVQSDELNLENIALREGNAFALGNPPDYFILADLPVEEALARLGSRTEKQDDAIFEKRTFLEKAQSCFMGSEYQDFLENHGFNIKTINTNQPIEAMKEESKEFISDLLG